MVRDAFCPAGAAHQDLFLSYFRANGGVEYLPGGTASGFRHVVPEEHPPRLLHIKGRVNVRMNQVPLGVASLNKGDVYILDLGATIFTVRARHAPSERFVLGEFRD